MTYLRKSVYLAMAALLFSTPSLMAASPAMAMGGHAKACCMQLAGLCGSQFHSSQTCCAQQPSGPLQQSPNYSPAHPDTANLLAPAFGIRGVEACPVFATDFFDGSSAQPGHISILRI